MDRCLMLDTRGQKYFTGSSLADVVLSHPEVRFDLNARCLVFRGAQDTVIFSNEYAHEELIREIAARARTVLKRYDFQFFHNTEI
jgi:hypothetical protein